MCTIIGENKITFCARALFSLNFRSNDSSLNKRKSNPWNILQLNGTHNIFFSSFIKTLQATESYAKVSNKWNNKRRISLCTYRLIFHECYNPFFRLRPGDDPIVIVDLSMTHWEDLLFLPIKWKSIKMLNSFDFSIVFSISKLVI